MLSSINDGFFIRFLVNSTADDFGLVDDTFYFVNNDDTAHLSIALIFGFNLLSTNFVG